MTVGLKASSDGLTGEIKLNGVVIATFDSTGFVTGAVNFATLAQAIAGSSSVLAINPSTLKQFGIPQTTKTAAFTLALADASNHIYYTGAAANLTVPTNASVAFPVGTVITVINNGSGALTIVTTGITMNQAGTTNTGNRTLATKGMATLIKVATDTWFISGAGIT